MNKVKIQPFNQLKDDMVTHMFLKTRYVTEGIAEDYMQWTSQNPVFLSAPTGAGKNFFVEDVLLRIAIKTNRKVLVISNRIACNRQQKKRIAHLTGCEPELEDLSPKGLDKRENFKTIRILTYQKLEIYLEDILELEKLKDFDLIVFDECHFFLSDSLFNPKTGRIFSLCLLSFQRSIRLYMSATPEDIFNSITEREKDLANGEIYNCINFNNEITYRPKEILYYDFQRNYKYISPKYFQDNDELFKLIKNDTSTDKWLIFVSSFKAGEEFVKEIGENNAIFIDASSKNSSNTDGKIYEEIITQEHYNRKVLVCTSVLDNGVNLKDDLLKNIVILSTDRTEFIQMLGRKRISSDEKITLYICARKTSYFNRRLFTLNKRLNSIYSYKDSPSAFLKQYFTGSVKDFEFAKGMFYFNRQSKICLNELAEKKLHLNKIYYERMVDKLASGIEEAFILEQLSWIGLEKTYAASAWISYVNPDNKIANFINFLEKHINIKLSNEALDLFEREFKTLVNIAYGKQAGDRPERPYKETKMRKIFKSQNLNYDIDITNGLFTLKKI